MKGYDNMPMFGYVTNSNSNNVSVIDTDALSPTFNTEVDVVPLGGTFTPLAIAITPDSTRAYIANFNADNVSVIDTNPNSPTFNTEIDVIPSSGNGPVGVAITPDGTRAYIANNLSSNVSVIDIDPSSPTYNTEVDLIPLTLVANAGPFNLAVTPDGTRVYVADNGPSGSAFSPNSVSVIDSNPSSPTYNTEVAVIPLSGVDPLFIDITPDGTRAYVTNITSNNVSVIDTNPDSPTYNTEIDLISLTGTRPAGIVITPDGTRAYIANNSSNNLSVIDTDPNSITYNTQISLIPLSGVRPNDVAITPDGARIYITNQSTNNVSIVDTNPASPTYNTEVDLIPLSGSSPYGIAIMQNPPPPPPTPTIALSTGSILRQIPSTFYYTVSYLNNSPTEGAVIEVLVFYLPQGDSKRAYVHELFSIAPNESFSKLYRIPSDFVELQFGIRTTNPDNVLLSIWPLDVSGEPVNAEPVLASDLVTIPNLTPNVP